jgi:hypothetical protein
MKARIRGPPRGTKATEKIVYGKSGSTQRSLICKFYHFPAIFAFLS